MYVVEDFVAYFLMVTSFGVLASILLSVSKIAVAIALSELFICIVPGILLFKLILVSVKFFPFSPWVEPAILNSGTCFFIVQVKVLSAVVSSLHVYVLLLIWLLEFSFAVIV